jgi:hypothetical protein
MKKQNNNEENKCNTTEDFLPSDGASCSKSLCGKSARLRDINEFYHATSFIGSLQKTVDSLAMGDQKLKFIKMFNYCRLMIHTMCDEDTSNDILLFDESDGILKECEATTPLN